MKAVISAVLLFSIPLASHAKASAPTQIEPLSHWLMDWQSHGVLHVPRHPRWNMTEQSEVDSEKQSDLLALYKNHLKSLNVKNLSGFKWVSREMAPEHRMPAGRPAPALFNQNLVVALNNDNPVWAFFPVDTNTGCDSGCAPLRFHIAYSFQNKNFSLLTEESQPLTKRDHVPLSVEDIKLLNQNLKKIPQLVGFMSSPSDTVQDSSTPAAQTWSLAQAALVAGGAYTSYRVYEAALLMQESLRATQESIQQQRSRFDELIGEAYRIQDPKQSAALSKKLKQAYEQAPNLSQEKSLFYKIDVALNIWPYRFGAQSSARRLAASLSSLNVAERNPSLLCFIYEDFLSHEKSRDLIEQLSRRDDFVDCPRFSKNWIHLIASTSVQEDTLQSIKSDLQIPTFMQSNPSLLLELVQKLHAQEQEAAQDLAQTLFHQLKARFPSFRIPETLGVEANDEIVQQKVSQLKNSYLQGLSQNLGSIPQSTLPLFEGEVQLPLAGRQIYIFLGTWCPHCRDLMVYLNTHIQDEKMWDKIQFVEVQSPSDDLYEAQYVCAELRLPEKPCFAMALIPNHAQFNEFRRKLRTQSVPRILITRPNGEIVDFDFGFTYSDPIADFRKLGWALEQAQ